MYEGNMLSPCRVLMIYPKFVPDSFWNYTEACELVGARYPAAPLGLITVAAMLPKHWDIRLVNRNTEPLTDADLDWADLVMIGGMLNQQPDFLYLIDLAHLRGKPVCVGGPDVSSSPHLYADADFQVIGEAEHVIEQFHCRLGKRRTQRRVHCREIQDRCHVEPDASLRSSQLRSLSIRRLAVFAWLPVHLRVLRYYRVVWSSTAYQDQRSDSRRVAGTLRSRLSRACRFRRRQFHRQQE